MMSKVSETMPDVVAEQLSAWLDDELPKAELELLIARATRSPSAHGRLERYGLIGAALRGGAVVPDARHLGERVRLALEAGQSSPRRTDKLPAAPAPGRRWQDNLVPFAAAATVLLTIFLMATIRSPSQPTDVTAQAGRTGMLMSTAVAAESRILQSFPAQTLLSRQRLTDYLVWHGEYTGTLAVQAADSHIVNDRSYAAASGVRFEYPAK